MEVADVVVTSWWEKEGRCGEHSREPEHRKSVLCVFYPTVTSSHGEVSRAGE